MVISLKRETLRKRFAAVDIPKQLSVAVADTVEAVFGLILCAAWIVLYLVPIVYTSLFKFMKVR